MIYKYSDYQIINESIINEGLSFDDLKNKFIKIKDKNNALQYLIKKYNSVKDFKIKNIISPSILILYLIISLGNIPDNNQIKNMNDELSKQSNITINDIDNVVKNYTKIGDNKISKDILKDPQTLRLSDEARKMIKSHEGLSLEAYEIGDGKITIGYGHAQPKNKSKYKVGDKITKNEAEELFKQDLNRFANAIRRMFKQWERSGIEVHITQGMFDAMVSMSYNMGVTRFRKSEFVKYLKDGDYINASSLIQDTAVSDKFPGLKNRRNSEYNFFIKDISDYLLFV